MDREAVYRRAQRLMENVVSHSGREQGYVLHHGLRVANLALRLAKTLENPVDEDSLWAAGLFHDAGKGLEPHWYTGRGIVLEHLKELTDGEEQLNAIAHLVRYHAKRSDPLVYSTELRLLQDADILDHRGALNVYLAVGHGVTKGDCPEAIVEAWRDPKRQLRREEFRKMLHYEASKTEYDIRLAQEEAFYQALEANCGK